MTILLSDFQVWPWPSTDMKKMFQINNYANFLEIHALT